MVVDMTIKSFVDKFLEMIFNTINFLNIKKRKNKKKERKKNEGKQKKEGKKVFP